MPRLQPQYQPQATGLQPLAAPDVQAQRARFDPNDSGAFQLAKALGALPVENLNSQVRAVGDAKMAEDRQAAEAFYNKHGMDVVGKMIKEGQILEIQSPAFNAALQHIYAENLQATHDRDLKSKLSSGELTFTNDAELTDYMTKQRNEALAGQSQYAIAGYDKHYASSLQTSLDHNMKVNNQKAVDRALQEASDSLGNKVLEVTQPGFQGDAAGEIVKQYKLLVSTSLLKRGDIGKQALENMVSSIATSGNTELVSKVLSQRLDSGATIKATIGDMKAVSLSQHAEAMNDKNNRQRVDVELRPRLAAADKGELDEKDLMEWAAKNERWVTTATLHAITSANTAAKERALRELQRAQMVAESERTVSEANQVIAAHVRNGTAFTLTGSNTPKVMTPTGQVQDADVESIAQKVIADDIKREGLGVEAATQRWTTNNVVNPEWQAEVRAGASNVASVGWAYDGKNVGQLNPQGQKALDTFMRINATNPGYAQKLVGNQKDYETMSMIQSLVETGGFPNVNDAAALVNQANRSGIEKGDYKGLIADVHKEVDDVIGGGFWSKKVHWVQGFFGNSEPNLTAIASLIRKRSEILVMSGHYKDAAAAVEASAKYYSNPAVTTNINNTLYLNSKLPAVPKEEDVGKWFGRFIDEVPGKIAKDLKVSGDVTLQPNSDGSYTAYVGGLVPLQDASGRTQTYRKDEVERWIGDTYKADMYKGMADRNYQLWKDSEMRKAGEAMKKAGVGNSAFGNPLGINSEMYSRATYERLLKEGKIKQGN